MPESGCSEYPPLCGDNIFNWRKTDGGGCRQVGVLKMCWNWVRSCPFQSIQVRLRGVGACYLRSFRTVGEECSAFTRQGSLVQIQPRPPFSTASRPISLAPSCSKFVVCWNCADLGSIPVSLGPFAGSRGLEFLDLRHLSSLVQIVN